eukprot:GHVS01082797.1.p1 GENE.GHVS01082797.1~~GHVS01082797.1.p1  ORF type:complete len:867 (+),score=98.00 GHVS01082797.1:77-2677(+)
MFVFKLLLPPKCAGGLLGARGFISANRVACSARSTLKAKPRNLISLWENILTEPERVARHQQIQRFPPSSSAGAQNGPLRVSVSTFRHLASACSLFPHAALEALTRLDAAVDIEQSCAHGTATSYNRDWDSYLKRGIMDMEFERCARIKNASRHLDPYDAGPVVMQSSVKADKRTHRARLVGSVNSSSSLMPSLFAGELFVLRPTDELTDEIVRHAQDIHGDLFDYSDVVVPAATSGGKRLQGDVWLTCSMCYSRFSVPNASLDCEDHFIACPSCGSSKKSVPLYGSSTASPLTDDRGRLSYRFYRKNEGWLGALKKTTIRGDTIFLTIDLYPILDHPLYADDSFEQREDFIPPPPVLADPYNVPPAGKSYWLSRIEHLKLVHERRLQALQDFCDPAGRSCSDCIHGLIIPTSTPPHRCSVSTNQQCQDRLDKSLTGAQKAAVEAAVGSRNPLCLIQGPPGTGKTRVAASIVAEWAMDPSDTTPISVSAGTHVAVEELKTKLGELGISCETLSEETAWKENKLKKRLAAFPEEFPPLSKQRSPVFVDTVYQACKLRYLRRRCSRVLVDESANMLEYSSLIPVAQGCQQLVLIGDQQQLAPISCRRSSSVAGPVSLFERLTRNPAVPAKLFLDTQFRMPYPLCEFSSAEFYDGALTSDKQMIATKLALPLPRGFPWPALTGAMSDQASQLPLLFIDTAHGTDKWQYEQAARRSRQNPVEVEIVSRVVDALVAGGAERQQIAVLTPYAGHRRLLKKRIQRQDEREQVVQRSFLRGVSCSPMNVPFITTVDGCQGLERDFVIFTAVRSNLSVILPRSNAVQPEYLFTGVAWIPQRLQAYECCADTSEAGLHICWRLSYPQGRRPLEAMG